MEKQPDLEKARKAVRKVIGANLDSYLDSVIVEQDYLEKLQQRADVFSSGETSLPFTIDLTSVYDVGSSDVNGSNTCAFINLKDSSALRKFLSDELEYEVNEKNSFAALMTLRAFSQAMSQKVGGLSFLFREFVLVHVRMRHRYRLLLIDNTSVTTLMEGYLDDDTATDPEKLDTRFKPISAKFTGLYDKVLMRVEDRVEIKRIRERGFIDSSVSYQVTDVDDEPLPADEAGSYDSDKLPRDGFVTSSGVILATSSQAKSDGVSGSSGKTSVTAPSDILNALLIPSNFIHKIVELTPAKLSKEQECLLNCFDEFIHDLQEMESILHGAWIVCSALWFPPAIALCWGAAKVAAFVLFILALRALSECLHTC
jgi:hypothetical protein